MPEASATPPKLASEGGVPRLSVVVPAYNEAPRIGATLDQVLAYLAQQDFPAEVIVVDDGSVDETAEVVQSRQPHAAGLRLVQYRPNQGKGRAVKTGFLVAQGALVLQMDADCSVPLEELDKLLAAVDAGAEVAIGSRALVGARLERRQAWHRELAGKAFGWVQYLVLGLPYSDTQCGFKLYTRRAVDALFPRQKLDSVVYDGELLYLAGRAGFRVAEVPVVWRHDPDSRIRYGVTASLAVFRDLWRVRWLHRRAQ